MPVRAPWTNEQVAALNEFQEKAPYHPFTCGKRSESPHTFLIRDVGLLVATPDGWVCHDCDYTQDWAHEFMFTDAWKKHYPKFLGGESSPE